MVSPWTTKLPWTVKLSCIVTAFATDSVSPRAVARASERLSRRAVGLDAVNVPAAIMLCAFRDWPTSTTGAIINRTWVSVGVVAVAVCTCARLSMDVFLAAKKEDVVGVTTI